MRQRFDEKIFKPRIAKLMPGAEEKKEPVEEALIVKSHCARCGQESVSDDNVGKKCGMCAGEIKSGRKPSIAKQYKNHGSLYADLPGMKAPIEIKIVQGSFKI